MIADLGIIQKFPNSGTVSTPGTLTLLLYAYWITFFTDASRGFE